ncbi:MAG: PAS domain S-box protein [Candidatus Hodarchaeota archaeon]
MSSSSKTAYNIEQIISENIEDLIFIYNRNFKCEYANIKINLEELFVSLKNKKLHNFIHSNDIVSMIKLLERTFKLGYGTAEVRFKYNDRIFNWYEIKSKRFDDQSNENKVILFSREITKFKKMEQEIKTHQDRFNEITKTLPEIRYWKFLKSKDGIAAYQKTREMLELVIDNIPQLIYWKDTNLDYLGCNQNFAALTGIKDPINIIGKKSDEICWIKEDLKKIQESERRVMANNKAEYHIIEFLVLDNGNQIWFEVNRIPLHNLDGEVVGVLSTYRDITIRRIAEQKLRESEEKYRSILENIKESYFEVDLNGNFTFFNDALCDLQGIPRNELLGMNFENFVDEENKSRIFQVYKSVYETEIPKTNFQFQFLKKNGERVICESSVYLRYDSNRNKVGFSGIARDITNKFRLEQKIKESEKKYRTIIENTKDTIVITGLDSNFLFVSPQFSEMLGREINEQSKLFKNIHPDDIHHLTELFSKAVRQKNVLMTEEVEFRAKHRDGHYIWLSSSSKNYYDDYGNLIGFISLLRDVTDKKIAEQKLKESEEKYRHLFESSPYAIWLLELDGTILDCNSTMDNILSAYERKDIIGKKFSEVLSIIRRPEFLIDLLKDRWTKFVKGEKLESLEFQITRVDGKKLWLEIQSSLVKLSDKTLLQAIIQDTTEKKNAEQKLKKSQKELKILNRILEQKVFERTRELRKSEQQYRTTIDSFGDSLHVVDRDLRIILMNQALKKWLKELNIKTDIIGSKISDIFPFLPEKIYEEYQQVFNTGMPLITTETTILPEIDVITETRKFPIIADGKVTQIITIIRDITESKKIEQKLIESERKLRDQNIELRKLDQIKNDFISMAAHELKTPLISISGYTDYILFKHKNTLLPEIFEDLKTVRRNVKRLEILMDQLLEVMKIDEGRLQLQIEETNVSKIINNCLDELSYLINEKNLEIILNMDYEIILNVDPTRIFLVFTNLISNAIKFTPDYGWIEISAKKEKEKYIFKIKDNGIGLTRDQIGRLFKKFERIKQPIGSKDTGTGLGLYISKGIVDAHGGEIWAKSKGLNEGTTFIFSLPF